MAFISRKLSTITPQHARALGRIARESDKRYASNPFRVFAEERHETDLYRSWNFGWLQPESVPLFYKIMDGNFGEDGLISSWQRFICKTPEEAWEVYKHEFHTGDSAPWIEVHYSHLEDARIHREKPWPGTLHLTDLMPVPDHVKEFMSRPAMSH